MSGSTTGSQEGNKRLWAYSKGIVSIQSASGKLREQDLMPSTDLFSEGKKETAGETVITRVNRDASQLPDVEPVWILFPKNRPAVRVKQS